MRGILDLLILVLIMPAIGLAGLLSEKTKQKLFDSISVKFKQQEQELNEISLNGLSEEDWDEVMSKVFKDLDTTLTNNKQ